MATVTLASLGLGNADLTAIGKLSETGLSQVEIADAVVEGDKLKKGNIPAGQVGAYTKAEVDGIIADIPPTDLSDYYNKAEVDSLIDAIPETDLTNYYNKAETYSKVEVDTKIADIPPTDLSGYYDKTEVDSLIADIPPTDLSNYYDKTETGTLISNKVDKEVGKGLSTNDFTNTFKQALELNKVQNVTTDSVTNKLVVTYTDGTSVDLNLDDIVTDVKVEGAVLDATTNVLTISSSDGGADITVDLSVFVTNQTLSDALVGKADKVHTHSPAEFGLGNVDNTSDEDKPMSAAQRAAMFAKFNLRDVAQETGSDGSKVMSQKASTESFYRAGSGVQKAGKIYVQSTEPTENVEEGDIWLKI